MAVYRDDPNLQGLWLMEEATGATRMDYTPNNNDLTDVNTVVQSSDHKEGSYSADFESANDEYLYILDGDQTGLDITGNITICAWIKLESISDRAIASKWEGGGDYSYLFRVVTSTGVLRCALSHDGTNYTLCDGATGLSTATWYHVAVVYNGTDIRIYLDGVLDTNGADNPKTYSSDIYDSATAFRVGAHAGPSYLFDGLIDELAVFDRALSATEVNDIFTSGIRERGIAVLAVMHQRRLREQG